MIWRVGMKAVCVDDQHDPGRGFGFEVWPIANTVYTIRAIHTHEAAAPDVLFLLEEIVNPAADYWIGFAEFRFISRRFRPAVDRPTSIAIFEKLLSPSPSREVETV